VTLFYLGEFALARNHTERSLALYRTQPYSTSTFLYGQDPGSGCLGRAAQVLRMLGYPDQAQERSDAALA
jgi:hypothetical protein